MIVTIHQPNFFAWVGFFDKMARADVFVLLDTVPFTKGGYQNRVQVKGSNGPQWLTAPVLTKDRLGQPTNEVRLDPSPAWRDAHLKTLASLYGRAPNFEKVMPLVTSLYARPNERLLDLNVPAIELARDLLGIRTPIVLASTLGAEGASSALLCDIVHKLGGTTYLSGPSGRGYLDESMFGAKGIAVDYHRFEPFPYPQRFGAFTGGLSVLDLLLNQATSPYAAA